MSELRLLAPAKLNLFLRVLARRPDGYHELATVFQKVSLYDEVRLARAERTELTVSGPEAVPVEGNLCLRAARLFFARTGIRGGVSIRLHKEIPAGSGLGGGSSDAAAVLLGLSRLYGGPSREELLELAPALGADVAFFLCPWSTALGRGIGEELSPWPTHPAWYLILLPRVRIETAWAYASLRLTSPRKPPNYEPGQPLWRQGLVNDFEPVVFARYPELGELKRALLRLGARAALLTGSGAALFGVFEGEDEARRAASSLEARGMRTRVATNHP